jgi:hypothetical protein
MTLVDDDTPAAQPLAADPPDFSGQSVMMTSTYIELGGVNLRCLGLSMSLEADGKPIEQTSFCAVQEYPGPVKFHMVAKFAQSFDPGGTFQVLEAGLTAYQTSGTPLAFKVRPYYQRPVSSSNPEFAGFLIPQEYNVFGGDAGTASEVDIDWTMPTKWSVNTGAVAATGATAGTPGNFTPAGATRPANLAALTGVAASPATAWAVGSYVITADLLGAHWGGSAWAAGVA